MLSSATNSETAPAAAGLRGTRPVIGRKRFLDRTNFAYDGLSPVVSRRATAAIRDARTSFHGSRSVDWGEFVGDGEFPAWLRSTA
jgi:hypothetical protein